MTNCATCQEETNNPKYCCRSCATTTNNKTTKRKEPRKCLECDSPVKSYRHTRCTLHFDLFRLNQKESYKLIPVGEYRQRPSVRGKHPSWVNNHVRSFARSWLKHLINEGCRHCGYNKHVELAHIRPVASFPDDTPMGVINSEDNVIPLCPNCHWEFDNLPRNLEHNDNMLGNIN